MSDLPKATQSEWRQSSRVSPAFLLTKKPQNTNSNPPSPEKKKAYAIQKTISHLPEVLGRGNTFW